jgi:cystathionine beta-lyase/cystathionine gamma-synthase
VTARALDACELATIAPSLGGVETLIEQPAIMSYYGLSSEERAALGIADGLVRLSVGVEDLEDIREDLARVLAVVAEANAEASANAIANANAKVGNASVKEVEHGL